MQEQCGEAFTALTNGHICVQWDALQMYKRCQYSLTIISGFYEDLPDDVRMRQDFMMTFAIIPGPKESPNAAACLRSLMVAAAESIAHPILLQPGWQPDGSETMEATAGPSFDAAGMGAAAALHPTSPAAAVVLIGGQSVGRGPNLPPRGDPSHAMLAGGLAGQPFPQLKPFLHTLFVTGFIADTPARIKAAAWMGVGAIISCGWCWFQSTKVQLGPSTYHYYPMGYDQPVEQFFR